MPITYTTPTSLNGSNTPPSLSVPLTWNASALIDSSGLLLHFDGTNGQTTTVDASGNNLVMTGHSATLETAVTQFGTAALNVPSGGGTAAASYFSTPVVANGPIDFSTGDFTVEMWVNLTTDVSGNSSLHFFQTPTSGINGISLNSSSGSNISVTLLSGSQIVGALTPSVYNHVAVVRFGTGFNLYVNGVAQAGGFTSSASLNMGGTTLEIGNAGTPNGAFVSGFIDELRITVGLARYTSNFTPPSAPFTNGGPPPGYEVYRNGVSIAAFLGGASYTDTIPGIGVYEYKVAAWDGTSDVSLLSAPFDLTVGAFTGTTPVFFTDEAFGSAYFGGKLNLVEFVYLPERDPFLEGATNLIINRYKQQPQDNRQRGVDYTFFLVPGETIQTLAVTGISAQGVPQASTVPLVTPLVVSNLLLDPSGLKFAYSVSGGQNGVEYTVQFTTTTQIQTSVVEEIFSINILVEDQFP